MKKAAILMVILMTLLLPLTGCAEKENLPHGKAKRICVMRENEAFTLGSGRYEFLENGLIKYVCDDNSKESKVYYFSIYTLSYIAEA